MKAAVKKFLESNYSIAAQFIAACVVTTFDLEVAGVIIFGLFLSLIFFVCDDLFHTFLPFMLVGMTVIKCYDSFNTFIVIAPLAAVPVIAAVYYFVKHKRRFKIGNSFWGIIIFSVAVTLGGVGIISARAYFSLTSVYYTLGLGFGMAVIYLIMNSWFDNDDKNTLGKRFANAMTLVAAFASFMVFEHYLENIQQVIANPGIIPFQWRNNISTFLMFALPFPFYLSREKWGSIFVGLLGYGALLLAGSRGGMLFGTVELLVCIAVVLFMDKAHRKHNLAVVGAMLVVVLCFSKQLFEFCYYTIQRIFDYDENKIRLGLFERAIEDFKSNPITGSGLANWENRDIHPSARFALCWYHSSPFQVIGSFGIVGVVCYLARLAIRVKIIFSRFNFFTAVMACSFLGIMMMSLVNPGEFCPIPYELIITLIFIILEKTPDKDAVKLGRNGN